MKVLDIDRSQAIRALKKLKAKFIEKHNFERIVFDLKPRKDPFASIRVRTNGKNVTMTLKDASKQTSGQKVSTPEWEVKTDDFNRTKELLYNLLYPMHTKAVLHVKNTREEYTIGKTVVTIDKWPRIPCLMEIEGPSASTVEKVYQKLNIKGKKIWNKPISEVYKRYNLDYHELFGVEDK